MFFIYGPLSGSSCIPLFDKLREPVKGLINIKDCDNECFLWCHIKHLNQFKIHSERIAKEDRKMVNHFDYADISCLWQN